MKNMKNLLTSLLAAATVAASAFSLASCSSAGANRPADRHGTQRGAGLSRLRPVAGGHCRRLRLADGHRLALHTDREPQQLHGGQGEDAGRTTEGPSGSDIGGISEPEGFGNPAFLPPSQMRALRAVLRNGGCAVHHLLAPAIHGAAAHGAYPLQRGTGAFRKGSRTSCRHGEVRDT